MIEWRRVPWSMWAYSAVVLTVTLLIEIEAHAPIPAKALLIALMLTWLYFLFRSVHWVWVVTVGIYVLGSAIDLVSGSLRWPGAALNLIGLVLLLLPVTRRYVASRNAGSGI